MCENASGGTNWLATGASCTATRGRRSATWLLSLGPRRLPRSRHGCYDGIDGGYVATRDVWSYVMNALRGSVTLTLT
jgi:hypothetical protein